MDVAIIVSTLAGLACAVAKALWDEQKRAKGQAARPSHLSRLEHLENREHI